MFNKLFTKILDSSIWLEPTTTRIVWITLLAAMDETGYAHFSAVENLAARARVTKEEAEKAIECFLKPDKNSANPDHQGSRVERVPGGFFILNAAAHRAMMNREIQKEQTRLRVAKHREKKKLETWRTPMAKTNGERIAEKTPEPVEEVMCSRCGSCKPEEGAVCNGCKAELRNEGAM